MPNSFSNNFTNSHQTQSTQLAFYSSTPTKLQINYLELTSFMIMKYAILKKLRIFNFYVKCMEVYATMILYCGIMVFK